MTSTLDLGPAAAQVKALLPRIDDDMLGMPTPCEHYIVGDLLDHFMGLSVAFRCAARKTHESEELALESRPGLASADHLDPAWREVLPVRLDELAAAWREPEAWQGMAWAGGVTMPAPVMATVAMNELVIHGWDLARATGQPFHAEPDSVRASFEFTAMVSQPGEEVGRQGIFGPVVSVPESAPLLDRALGNTGRDPRWRA